MSCGSWAYSYAEHDGKPEMFIAVSWRSVQTCANIVSLPSNFHSSNVAGGIERN